MAELVVYGGEEQYLITPSSKTTYLYRIGSGTILGREFTEINDADLLHDVAGKIRDSYSEWIYLLKDNSPFFASYNNDISLFFLSDLSCKRGEYFDTYDTICNLTVIRKKIAKGDVTRAILVGVDDAFARAFKSIFDTVPVVISRRKQGRLSHWAEYSLISGI